MNMDKNTFLRDVAKALGHNEVPDIIAADYDYNAGLQYDRLRNLSAEELRRLFEEEAKVRAYIYKECTSKNLGALLHDIIAEEAPTRVACTGTKDAKVDVTKLLKGVKAEVLTYDRKRDAAEQRALIEKAEVGITIPAYAMADTGTVVELADDDCGKVVSLLPVAHISIIFQSRLRATMTDVMQELEATFGKEGTAKYFTFISGPSSTGDIESIMVTGVHGPTREYNIVVTDM